MKSWDLSIDHVAEYLTKLMIDDFKAENQIDYFGYSYVYVNLVTIIFVNDNVDL